MKTPINLLLIILFLSFNSCSKEDNCENPIDCLPPSTQTGAGTFGCLINGEPFVDTSGKYNCFYQFVDGGYYFNISGSFDSEIAEVNLGTIDMPIEKGKTYRLESPISRNATASLFLGSNLETLHTGKEFSGELHVTSFDLDSRIVSGTFWFDVYNPETGKTIRIREGRFDSLFTR